MANSCTVRSEQLQKQQFPVTHLRAAAYLPINTPGPVPLSRPSQRQRCQRQRRRSVSQLLDRRLQLLLELGRSRRRIRSLELRHLAVAHLDLPDAADREGLSHPHHLVLGKHTVLSRLQLALPDGLPLPVQRIGRRIQLRLPAAGRDQQPHLVHVVVLLPDLRGLQQRI